MPKPRISFVVPLFNHLADTQAMLSSLRESLPPELAYEVVLVDDYSTDGTREWLAGLDDACVRTVLNPENRGFARTCNAGARLARGEILGLLNNDLLFSPGWLEPMLDILESPGLNAGMVGNVQFRVEDGELDHAGVHLNPLGKFEHLQTLSAGDSSPAKVLAATGACVLLRRADFDALGGFDEAYVNGCEDIDLCYKIRAARKAIYVATASRIRHHVSLSRDRGSVQNERNSRYLCGKWRNEIKRDLASLWSVLLQSGPAAYAEYVHGELDAAFVAMPQIAARTVAEAMLLREEFRWARELGNPDHNADVASRCKARGLRFIPRFSCYLLEGKVEIVVEGLRSTRNFYVCGRKIDPQDPRPMAVTLTVNGMQRQTIPLVEPSINAGIIDPILLQGIDGVFRVEVNYLDPVSRAPIGDASKAVVLTHIVIDDRRIDRF